MSFWKRESYIVAAAPALAFLGVYIYEWGRYRYLKTPTLLIDLPIDRLLMGGTAIALLVSFVAAGVAWLIDQAKKRSMMARIVPSFLATFLLFGLPVLMWSVSWLGVVIAVAGVIGMTFCRAVTRDSSDESDAENQKNELSWTDRIMGFVWMVGFGALSLAGLGFQSERLSKDQTCVDHGLVVAVRGDRALVKPYSMPLRELTDAVLLVPLDGLSMAPCTAPITGDRTLGIGASERAKKS